MNCAIPRIRAVALILLVSFNQIVGRKTDISIVNDVRSAFLVEPFCFDDDGFVDIRLQNFVQYEGTNQLASPKNVGFIVRKTNNPQAAYNPAVVTEFLDGCILSREYMLPGDVKIMIDKPDLNASFHTDSLGSGLYTVIYANCAEGTMVSYDLHMTLTNRGGQMLPAGSIPLPICFGIFFFAFLIALVVWVVVMLRNRESTHRIHVLMAVLCAVKMLSAGLDAVRYEVIRTTGEGGGWNQASYVFAGLKGIMFFSVVLLVGSGWSFVKPFLSTRDKRIVMVVIPLQVVVNIASVIVEEMSPATMGWLTWRDILHLFDILCCCATLFPIVGSIRNLKDAALGDNKAARTLQKLKLFREFYLMVVVYIYFSRIAVYVVLNTLPCWYAQSDHIISCFDAVCCML
mmetsp:Transcript_80325/g.215308  ORF Transcript_80325/g.215308 Transcript_80325/m.215308 type:complete len:401 (-) Transcript_80325:284-1486(-)